MLQHEATKKKKEEYFLAKIIPSSPDRTNLNSTRFHTCSLWSTQLVRRQSPINAALYYVRTIQTTVAYSKLKPRY